MPSIQLQLRRSTAAEWTDANPTLAEGEVGLELDTGRFKVGIGSTGWNFLPYGGLAGPTGPAGADGVTGSTGPVGPIGGVNTQVLFNNSGSASGSAAMTFNNTTGILTVSGLTLNTSRIGFGLQAGNLSQGLNSVAIGSNTGSNTQGTDAVAIGTSAAQQNQGSNSVAIGNNAGSNTQSINSIAIGTSAARQNQAANSISIGSNAANTSQGLSSIAIGTVAGFTRQGQYSVAIGDFAGSNTQGDNNVAVGRFSGQITQGAGGVAIGYAAGRSNQAGYTVALGFNAGMSGQRDFGIAIGYNAGISGQGSCNVAIGLDAGRNNQGSNSVAIGRLAGSNAQGTNSIAIGNNAGLASQISNSIILNATGSALNATTLSGFYVAPVSQSSNLSGLQLMTYNPLTSQIQQNSNITLSGGNVGIGTTTPTASKLVVDGQLTASTAVHLFLTGAPTMYLIGGTTTPTNSVASNLEVFFKFTTVDSTSQNWTPSYTNTYGLNIPYNGVYQINFCSAGTSSGNRELCISKIASGGFNSQEDTLCYVQEMPTDFGGSLSCTAYLTTSNQLYFMHYGSSTTDYTSNARSKISITLIQRTS